MKLASTLTAVRLFFQGLLDESPHSLAFAIQHWGGGGFDGDPGLPNALQSMSTAMSQVLELLNLAQSIRGENQGVHVWLMDLKDAAYAADDLLSELDYYRLHHQVEASEIDSSASRSFSHLLLTNEENQASTSSPSQYPSLEDNRSKLVPRMNENVRRLGTITTSLSSVLSLLKLVEDCQPNPHDFPVASHRITTSFASSKQTVLGRDSERDQIIKLLLLPTRTSVSMIPIVGMGGIGKTTLAKMVYKHEQIKKHFDQRIWVCVSDNFDVARFTREILEGLCFHGFDHTTHVKTLEKHLMEKLQYVRYLLVLDDVWNDSEEEKWTSLCTLLRSQKLGSRILMTTRLNTVVSIAAKNIDMLSPCPLESLPKDQYLSLFNTYAFGDRNPSHHPILVEIGKRIIRRLKGSPLAAKTMGGLLRENLDEDHWRSILGSDIWQLPQSHDDIMPVLQLSYQHLAWDLQQCFTYCSVFPKDYQFEKDRLVAMWISHGYIRTKSRGNNSVEEIGNQYFDNLLSRSFIQVSVRNDELYILHDLLHDLAKSVSENECFWQETKEITSRHMYVYSKDLDLLKSCNLRNLRTLIINGDLRDDYSVLKDVLNGLKSMRVLSLENVSVEFWWGSIGHLIHLRYLAVTSPYQSMSPEPQCWPYHLQWLVFTTSSPLVLPSATNYLLRQFVLENEPNGWIRSSRMSGIGNLTCLQGLMSFTVGKKEGRKFAELKRLNELRGTLQLYSLDNASTKEEALEANLNKKVGIRKLDLHCHYPGHATPQMAEEVFEGLCPPAYIDKLTLNAYHGVKSPTWMMMTENSCLLFLQSLELRACLNWRVLPSLGQLPLLRHLVIYEADAVEEIGNGFYGSGVAKSFPCLVSLKFKDMPEWVVWSGVEEDTDSLFPVLRELIVMNCPKLERVPVQCLASVELLQTSCMVLLAELENLTSLKELIVKGCGEMQSLALLSASLETLEIDDCDQLSSLFTTETETNLPSLRNITISRCNQLVSVVLNSHPSLQKLRIARCERIQSVPVLPTTLAELNIEWLPMLTAFSREQEENLSDHTSLQKI